MLPVSGARSEFDCRESSKLLLFAAGIYFSTRGGSLDKPKYHRLDL